MKTRLSSRTKLARPPATAANKVQKRLEYTCCMKMFWREKDQQGAKRNTSPINDVSGSHWNLRTYILHITSTTHTRSNMMIKTQIVQNHFLNKYSCFVFQSLDQFLFVYFSFVFLIYCLFAHSNCLLNLCFILFYKELFNKLIRFNFGSSSTRGGHLPPAITYSTS